MGFKKQTNRLIFALVLATLLPTSTLPMAWARQLFTKFGQNMGVSLGWGLAAGSFFYNGMQSAKAYMHGKDSKKKPDPVTEKSIRPQADLHDIKKSARACQSGFGNDSVINRTLLTAGYPPLPEKTMYTTSPNATYQKYFYNDPTLTTQWHGACGLIRHELTHIKNMDFKKGTVGISSLPYITPIITKTDWHTSWLSSTTSSASKNLLKLVGEFGKHGIKHDKINVGMEFFDKLDKNIQTSTSTITYSQNILDSLKKRDYYKIVQTCYAWLKSARPPIKEINAPENPDIAHCIQRLEQRVQYLEQQLAKREQQKK
jgi:hypothetical protein